MAEDGGGWWRVVEDGGGWWRMVEDAGGWWRMVEDGGGWWRMVDDYYLINYLFISNFNRNCKNHSIKIRSFTTKKLMIKHFKNNTLLKIINSTL